MSFRLSVYEKGVLISMSQELNEDGTWKYTLDIAKKLGCCRQTVSRIVYKFEQTNSINNMKPEGRPPKLNETDRRYVHRLVCRDPFICLADLLAEIRILLGIEVSETTLSRVLRDFGLYSRRPSLKSLLTKDHRTKRIEFCNNYKDYPVNFWRNVIFSDESRFCLAYSSGRMYVWRANSQRWNPKYTDKKNFHEKRGILVWGCMTYYTVGPLITISDTLDSQAYVELLEKI